MNLNTLLIVTGDFKENCFLLWDAGASMTGTEAGDTSTSMATGEASVTPAVVFDPGDEADKIDAELKRRGLTIGAFLQTHCHGDHIAALTPLKQRYPAAPLYVPEAEMEWLQRPTLNLSYFYGYSITGPKPEHAVRDGDEIAIAAARITLRAIHVPGHSPGGTAYYVAPDGGGPGGACVPGGAGALARGHLFCGDILFAGGIGRTDLPGSGGEDQLVAGIREKLFTLPEETIVHPGHGPETTIGEEKRTNPYCGVGV